MAATVTIDGDTLSINITGLDQLWALKSQLDIPLAHVLAVTIDPNLVLAKEPGLLAVKWPGTYLPGVITAGTFLQHGEWVFWDVHDPQKTIILDLHDDRYSHLIIQVDDPAAVKALIEAALPGRAQ